MKQVPVFYNLWFDQNEARTHDLLQSIYFYSWCFNATFNNISAISWRPVLVVEEAAVLGENNRPWATN
jgi:hypothetical protein